MSEPSGPNRRRKHRRVIRPATGGDPGPEPREDAESKADAPGQGRDNDHEQWLKEQRPPHWE